MIRPLAALLVLALPAAAAACPDWASSNLRTELAAAAITGGWQQSVRAGGPFRLKECRLVLAGSGVLSGYAQQKPQATVRLRGLSGHALEMRVEGRCAPTLLVNTPNETFLFAGGSGRKPELRLARPAEGLYDIWVGAAEPGGCAATLTLRAVPQGTRPGLARGAALP